MREFKSPKKQRKHAFQHPENVEGRPVVQYSVGLETAEGVGGNGDDLGPPSQPHGYTAEPVTAAARAFTQLRVRPATSGIENIRARSPSSQPRSPKKRKASVTIDKEFILKDEKVKRNTDKQEDISDARGVLGQLLFEFRHLELNRDILEAIKRTESRTGRHGRNARRRELDRIAFEYVVAEAGELLHTQLSTVTAHSEDADVQRALLCTYAVQAIAAFADEDVSDSENEDDAGCSSGSGSPAPPSPHQILHDAQLENEAVCCTAPAARDCEEHGHSPVPLRQRQSIDMTRAGSVTPLDPPASRKPLEPAHQSNAGGQDEQQQQQQQQLAPHSKQDTSANEQVSSSLLPDAPPAAAVEDTATKGSPEQLDTSIQGRGWDLGAGHGGDAAQAPLSGHRQPVSGDSAGMAAHAASGLQRQHAQPGGIDDVMQQLSDAVDDMLRSPDAAVSSRRRAFSGDTSQPTTRSLTASHTGSVPTSSDQGRGHLRGAAAAPGEAGDAGRHLDNVAAQASCHAACDRLPCNGAASGQPREQPGSAPSAAGGHQQHSQPEGQGGLREEQVPRARDGEGDLEQGPYEQDQTEAGAADGPSLVSHHLPAHVSQQPAVHAEALKRQRTSTSDDRAQVRAKHGGRWLQRLQEQTGMGEATSPLCPLDARAGPCGTSQQKQQQPPQQQPGYGPAPHSTPPPRGPQQEGLAGGQQQEQSAEEGTSAGMEGDGSLQTKGAGQYGSSVWGSTLVCADLTVNDVASKYWPFLRTAVQGQIAELGPDDKSLLSSLVKSLGDTIDLAYAQESGGRHPLPETKSLIAATAFDDMFRDKFAQDSSGGSK